MKKQLWRWAGAAFFNTAMAVAWKSAETPWWVYRIQMWIFTPLVAAAAVCDYRGGRRW